MLALLLVETVVLAVLVLGTTAAVRRSIGVLDTPPVSRAEPVRSAATSHDPTARRCIKIRGQLLMIRRISPLEATIDGVRTDSDPVCPAGSPFALDVQFTDDELDGSGPYEVMTRWIDQSVAVEATLTVDPGGPRLHMTSGSEEVSLPVAWTAGLSASG